MNAYALFLQEKPVPARKFVTRSIRHRVVGGYGYIFYFSPMPSTPENTSRGFGRRTAAAASPTVRGKNYLFVIAVDRYAHLPRLHNAVLDARKVAELLVAEFGFEAANVIALYDEAATEDNILGQFRELARTLTPADNLLIYFSGHGHYDQDFKQGAWLPVAARADRAATYLPNSSIHSILNAIEARHIFLVCDACYAGSLFSKYRNASDNIDRLENLRSRWGLTAGRTEIVMDGQPGDHSPFAKSLLRHLNNASDKLGVATLCQRVLEDVGSNSEQLPRGEPLQGVRHEGGQFFFRRRTAAAPAPPAAGRQQGQLLHNLPERMQHQRATRCEVRIATDAQQLLPDAGLDPERVTIRAVRVSDTMGVRLVDPLGGAFQIRPISSETQFIHPETYTQWVFYVKPLTLGRHPLVITVAIIELINGRERAREIVLEETIEVTAELPERVAAIPYKTAGYQFTVSSTGPLTFDKVREQPDTTQTGGGPPPPIVAPAPVKPLAPRRSLRPILSGIAAVLLVGMAVWFMLPGDPVPGDQSNIKGPDDEVPVVKPAEPGGGTTPPPELRTLEANAWRRAETLNTAAAYEAYLQDYPNGTHAGEARRRVIQLRPVVPEPAEPLRPMDELLDRTGSLTDPRSGQSFSYRTVGKYTWLNENVAYAGAGKDAGGVLGRVYNYAEARRACPAGWRLPQRKEAADLLQALGGNRGAFVALQPGGSSGLAWPMAGKISAQGNAIATGRGGAYWTAQTIGELRAYALEFDYIAKRVDWKANYKTDYLSCRCVRE